MTEEKIKPGYTRVSDFCSRYEDFGSVDPAYLQHRADIGTEVHAGIRGFLCDVPVILSEEARPYFESWIEWYELIGMPAVTHEETRMYCDKWKLTGAIDGIIHFSINRAMIVDWKTSSSVDNDIWPLKGAFYHHLVGVNELVQVAPKVLYLKLDKHGGEAVQKEYEITNYLKGMVTATMMVHRHEEKFGKDAVPEERGMITAYKMVKDFEDKVKANKKNWRTNAKDSNT
jgi:hypothetical protein